MKKGHCCKFHLINFILRVIRVLRFLFCRLLGDNRFKGEVGMVENTHFGYLQVTKTFVAKKNEKKDPAQPPRFLTPFPQ